MSAESVLEQLSREVVAGERLSFVVRGAGAEAILALIAHVRALKASADALRDALDVCAVERVEMLTERDEARAEVERQREADGRLATLRADMERALAAGERRGGMQVPYTGPLASVVYLPSVQHDLRAWLRMVDAPPTVTRAADAGPVTVVGDEGPDGAEHDGGGG